LIICYIGSRISRHYEEKFRKVNIQ